MKSHRLTILCLVSLLGIQMIQMKATEQYFPVFLLIILYNVLTFEAMDGRHK